MCVDLKPAQVRTPSDPISPTREIDLTYVCKRVRDLSLGVSIYLRDYKNVGRGVIVYKKSFSPPMTSSNQRQSSQSHVSPGQTRGGYDEEEEKVADTRLQTRAENAGIVGRSSDGIDVRDESDDDESVMPDSEDTKEAKGRSKLKSIMLVVTCTTAMILNARILHCLFFRDPCAKFHVLVFVRYHPLPRHLSLFPE